MKFRIFHYKPSLCKVFALVVFIPPIALFIMTFSTAMIWRTISDTRFYSLGNFASGALTLLVFFSFFLLLRFVWNTFTQRRYLTRLLAMGASLSLILFYVALPSNYPPLKRLLDDFFGKVYYIGEVTPDSFVKLKRKIDKALFPPTKIIVGSGGGNTYAGLAIGYLIHKNQLDVEVLDVCSSSCANYLFPAGNKKVLNKHSIVMYHGNSLQKSMVDFTKELESVNGDISKLPKDITLGKKGKEVSITLPQLNKMPANNSSGAIQSVFEYLGWHNVNTFIQAQRAFIREEKQFYEKLGIDQNIGIYGQIGKYKQIYQSYQYDGFYYSIEDMKKMGIQNIHVKNAPWQPELNPLADNFYKITF